MHGIRAAAVGNAMALDATIKQVDQMEARVPRGDREIDDADHVVMAHIGAACVERGLGAGEQLRVDASWRLRAEIKRRQRVNRARRGVNQRRQARRRRGRQHRSAHANRTPTQDFPPIQRHSAPPEMKGRLYQGTA